MAGAVVMLLRWLPLPLNMVAIRERLQCGASCVHRRQEKREKGRRREQRESFLTSF